MAAKTSNGPELLPETTELATAANFAAVSTVLPDCGLQNQLTWVHVVDGKLALNTETHRAKYLNVVRDPRITVLIRDEKDPYRYAEVRGRVEQTTTGSRARSQIDDLAHKYTGDAYPPQNIKSERVILWVTPRRQTFIDQKQGIAD
jgi:PPOX class probable F420-dependent enzyme